MELEVCGKLIGDVARVCGDLGRRELGLDSARVHLLAEALQMMQDSNWRTVVQICYRFPIGYCYYF
jgi:hypothetical protein